MKRINLIQTIHKQQQEIKKKKIRQKRILPLNKQHNKTFYCNRIRYKRKKSKKKKKYENEDKRAEYLHQLKALRINPVIAGGICDPLLRHLHKKRGG
ncbi:hypothetical protein GDO86_014096 [Hymenochirus boettgeri]|uniref:Uncharacterized protein n=1 Tax=Hymenochirus boettgeri TaxID=247094 RepID=A0A8T2JRQ4_9PIPI|nr:hypothetical protein GDO86_014096 [Hymenochirus boettgeri]